MKTWAIEELDDLMAHFDEGYAVSHDEAYRRFAANSAQPPSDLPEDPFDPAYRARYMEIYKTISTRAEYVVSNEGCDFNIDQLVQRPFPYFTGSSKLAGLHFTLMGKLLEVLDVPSGGSILECGFGSGNTTLALAMLGYRVTALDIEAKWCELVRRRAEIHNADVCLINNDYLWVETATEKFDAVVFFESFHHCWEFERLLNALHRVLKPGGKIYFAAEPINDHFTVPWGVRLDGESLLVARRNGWMELGFRSDYFEELLRRTGWRGHCVHPHFWVASPSDEPMTIAASDPRLTSQVGGLVGNVIEFAAPTDSGGYAVYGPYITLPAGSYTAELVIETHTKGRLLMDVVSDGGALIAASEVAVNGGALIASCDFALDRTTDLIEARLFVPPRFAGSVSGLSFRPRVATVQ
jgi:SAM-dependent methyltransferase